MRIVWRLLLLLLLLAVIYFYFYDGKLSDVKSVLEEATVSHEPITVYRWRDRDGNWAYGSAPPPGVKYETRSVDPDKNVAPAVPTGDKKKDSILPFSQEDIRQMFERATQFGKQPDKAPAGEAEKR